MLVCCWCSEPIDVDVTLVQIIFCLPLKFFGCPSCAWLHSSPHHETAALAFFFLFFICFTCWNVKTWLHCQYFNSVQKHHYWFWYRCYLIMDGNESCPQAENSFKNESKSLAIRSPWEAIISQDSCVVWSWRLVVLQFFMFPIVEPSHVIFLQLVAWHACDNLILEWTSFVILLWRINVTSILQTRPKNLTF